MVNGIEHVKKAYVRMSQEDARAQARERGLEEGRRATDFAKNPSVSEPLIAPSLPMGQLVELRKSQRRVARKPSVEESQIAAEDAKTEESDTPSMESEQNEAIPEPKESDLTPEGEDDPPSSDDEDTRTPRQEGESSTSSHDDPEST